MISATQGAATAIYYRPVEAIPAIGPRAEEPRARSGAETAGGERLSPEKQPLESLSREKRLLLARLRGELASLEQEQRAEDVAAAGDPAAEAAENPAALSEEEQAAVDALQKQDRETRAHEQAHAAIGGAYAGAPSYEYAVGPDGRRYAVAGEVKIDASPIPGDPEATLEKMRVIERAALAPAEPSGQDRKVARQAKAEAQAAQAEAARAAAPQAETEAETERRGAAEAGYAAGRVAFDDAPPPILAIAA